MYANDKLQQTLNGLQGQANGGDHKSYHAATVVNAVNGLRAGTLPANTFLKSGTANRYCVVHSGFEIEYMIGTPNSQTDIVIVDIRLVEKKVEDTKRAGLWAVEKNDQGWAASSWKPELDAWPRSGVDHNNRIKVGINGYCNDIDHAARMLPSHIARGEKRSLTELAGKGYQLFYVPGTGNLFKAGWQSVAQMGKARSSKNDVEAAKILAAHMLEAHSKGLHVEWTSHRGGSFVLTEAMKFLNKGAIGKTVDLEKRQTVFFSDPSSSLAEADHARRKVNVDTQDSKWYNGSKSSLAYSMGAQEFGSAPLVCSFNAIGDEAKSQKVAAYSVWGAGATGTGYGLYLGAGALLSAGAAASAGLGAGGLVAALNTVLNNVPSLNEDYHTHKFQGAKTLIGKVANKISA
ncbi:hypothetical protein G8770_23300 [Aestuariicella hydrocarbonica]|uniref:Uncharacterized protein n=1 Tax=Pseudomaricurvus hydrocarbonicus TaxID=1470433 RepID=A0A9E5MQH6_9GAMM|nr:hypothetical protein [Aestuariicella hydrocarbonica]NHO68489.1 hypothetical protein [Aestuariicella hydrocarbonica]